MRNFSKLVLALVVFISLMGFEKNSKIEKPSINKTTVVTDTLTWKLLGDIKYIRKNLTEASETLAKAEAITKQYEQDLAQERRESQLIIASAQKEAQEIVAMEINQAQKDTEALVNEATQQLNTQKEKALLALEEQVNTLSEQIKNKLLSGKLTA